MKRVVKIKQLTSKLKGKGGHFFTSLLATTVSIALTFGTAAIIDHRNEQKDKHEIVMMVMYDMYSSLQAAEEADAKLSKAIDIQLQIAEDTSKFNEFRFQLPHLLPIVEFTETTEHIFSSSIETINTVGNVLFSENVASFYQNRQLYKKSVSDSVLNRLNRGERFSSAGSVLDFDFINDALISNVVVGTMRKLYEQCLQMMDVTEAEIEAYSEERAQMNQNMSDHSKNLDSVMYDLLERQNRLDRAKEKLITPGIEN